MLPGAAHGVFVQVGPGRARARAPVFRRKQGDRVVVELGVDQARGAHEPVGHRLPERPDGGGERVRRGGREPQAFFGGEPGEVLRLGHRRGQRLFGIDVLARLERGAAHRVVRGDGSEVRHAFDRRVGEQRLVRRVDREPVEPPDRSGARRVPVGDAGNGELRMAGQRRHVVVEHVAGADHPDLHAARPLLAPLAGPAPAGFRMRKSPGQGLDAKGEKPPRARIFCGLSTAPGAAPAASRARPRARS